MKDGIRAQLSLRYFSAVCYSKILTSTSFNMQFATKLFATVVAVASVASALPNVDTPVSVVAVRLTSNDWIQWLLMMIAYPASVLLRTLLSDPSGLKLIREAHPAAWVLTVSLVAAGISLLPLPTVSLQFKSARAFSVTSMCTCRTLSSGYSRIIY